MVKVLAMNIEGKLTYCSAPIELRGKGRCNHVAHQKEDESKEDFIKRISEEKLKISTIADNLREQVSKEDAILIRNEYFNSISQKKKDKTEFLKKKGLIKNFTSFNEISMHGEKYSAQSGFPDRPTSGQKFERDFYYKLYEFRKLFDYEDVWTTSKDFDEQQGTDILFYDKDQKRMLRVDVTISDDKDYIVYHDRLNFGNTEIEIGTRIANFKALFTKPVYVVKVNLYDSSNKGIDHFMESITESDIRTLIDIVKKRSKE